MRLIAATLLLALAAACGGDSTPSPVVPTGTWNMTLTWGSGTCSQTGAASFVLAVTSAAGGGYNLGISDPTFTTTGTMNCNATQCVLSASLTQTVAAGTGIFSMNLTLSTSNAITGSGTLSQSPVSGSSCTQPFSVTGTKS